MMTEVEGVGEVCVCVCARVVLVAVIVKAVVAA